MKTVKPHKLSVLVSPFEAGEQLRLCVTTMLATPIDAPESPIHEATLWKMLAKHLGRDVPPDLCRPKPLSEVVVIGSAYPRNPPQVACSVRLALGKIDKTLWVVGDRTWNRAGVASDPVPFEAMPVTWANAFGGAGFADNPTGKGFAAIKTDTGDVHPLPNVENPKRLVRLRGDRPEPAGFGPHDLLWPERYSKSGTYDNAWLDHQYPGLPLDFNFEFYNTAPLDQRLGEHFKGDETYTLENMHPSRPLIEGRIPRFVPRAFVNMKGGEFREVPMRMDTLQLFPSALMMVVLYRGVTDIVEDDASDVLHLVAGCDAPGALRPIEHFKAVLEERLDMKRASLASLRQGDLMPPGAGSQVSFSEIADEEVLEQGEFLRRKNLHRKANRDLEAHRERLASQGIDPDKYLPKSIKPLPDTHPSTLEEEDAMRAAGREKMEKLRADGAKARAETEAEGRRVAAAAGRDYDALVAEGKRKAGGPPKFSASTEVQRTREMAAAARRAGKPHADLEARLANGSFEQSLRTAEESFRNMYRKSAQLQEPALPAEAALTERARIELPAGAQGGVSFEERDLTGVDLHGLDLRNVDLNRAFLEGADLTGCDLRGAVLTGAVLARAKLDGADLTGAKLADANLGKASLVGAKLEGELDMTGAILTGADLTRTSLVGARLLRADLSEATFVHTDLSRVVGEGIIFNKADLRTLKVAGARFVKCKFLESDVSGVDFSGVDLSAATFLETKASGAAFRGANLYKLRAVRGTVFDGADFTGAKLERASLRGLSLVGCNFTGAEMDRADLSECDLQEANLYRAVARGARFVKADLRHANLTAANLMRTLMDRANLRGANLTGVNLFRADLCRADVDQGTITKDAHLNQMRFVQARKPAGEPTGGLQRGRLEPS